MEDNKNEASEDKKRMKLKKFHSRNRTGEHGDYVIS
jgi:hypothetical protein